MSICILSIFFYLTHQGVMFFSFFFSTFFDNILYRVIKINHASLKNIETTKMSFIWHRHKKIEIAIILKKIATRTIACSIENGTEQLSICVQ